MSFNSTPSPFSVLQELGIVDASDYKRVLAHPDRAELFGYLALDDYVVWLVGRGLLSKASLEAGRARIVEDGAGHQYLPLIARAQHKLLVLEARASHDCFHTLVAEGIITGDECEDALVVVMEDEVIDSPAAALAWMVLEAEMTPERLDEIRAVEGGSARRAAIIAEADMLLDEHGAAAREASARVRWRWLGALVLAAGVAMWISARLAPQPQPEPAPASVPTCDDAGIVRTINTAMATSLPAHDGMSIAMARGRPLPKPALDRYVEVGFASETGIRGCFARLSGGDRAQVHAYILARDAVTGRIVLNAAAASMVQARYGHLDAGGRFIHRADPIGRAALRKAFDAAADQITEGKLDPLMIAQLRRTVDRKVRYAEEDPEPEHVRRIVDIEPLAPCRDLGSGNSFSCRLMVEHNDPVSVVFGGTKVHEGDFTVVRDGPGGAWRMGSVFSRELGIATAGAPPAPP
ncbi:hypothetical protein IV454_29325 [Massilia antarctica]|uniref:Uncharacterized protein n=1 Tax=Massilia antarctica TaxID=2765360 RepID=A0AA49A8C2_9BURK|nr:hypothetical protein [Massilia antarctica]QPI49490.1 hypothetical protein IV454_29325 [Massilia antarctica]